MIFFRFVDLEKLARSFQVLRSAEFRLPYLDNYDSLHPNEYIKYFTS